MQSGESKVPVDCFNCLLTSLLSLPSLLSIPPFSSLSTSLLCPSFYNSLLPLSFFSFLSRIFYLLFNIFLCPSFVPSFFSSSIPSFLTSTHLSRPPSLLSSSLSSPTYPFFPASRSIFHSSIFLSDSRVGIVSCQSFGLPACYDTMWKTEESKISFSK